MKLKFSAILILFNVLNAQIEFVYRWNDWATHQPVLYEIATNTTGPIIEFGCGDNSTDLLHEICKRTNRILVTVEDDFEWMNKFAQKYLGDGYSEDNSGWHKFYFVSGKSTIENDTKAEHWITFLDNFELLKTMNFDLCFIDQSPWQARIETILRLKNKARYIILHDCDYFVSGALGETIQPMNSKDCVPGIYDFSKTFKYFKVYFPLKPWPGLSGPPTLLGSDFESILPDIDYNNY